MPGVPQSKGTVDPVFLQGLSELQEQADKLAKAAETGKARVWQVPEAQTTDMSEIEGLQEGYKRDSVGKNFSGLLDADAMGTVGDVIGVKTQHDYIAMQERAYRARHASPLRNLAFAAGRRAGHGHEAGIFGDTSGVGRYVADAIAAGKSKSGYNP